MKIVLRSCSRSTVCRLMLLLAAVSGAMPSRAQEPEYRGFWADAWSTDLWTASSISQVMSDLRAGNMNLLVAQVRRRGDALYNSHYEPKCADISASFDPLADMIAKGHNTNDGPRVEIHGWLVTYHVWKGPAMPSNPNHPLNLHPDWMLKDVNGATLINNEYTFDPGHPEVQKHTFNVCMDLVTQYDIDGLNFDYIRYSSTAEGYNDVTVARFNRLFNRTGVPSTGDAVWKQFRRDQITALLRKIYLNAIAVKPGLKISCDTITWDPAPTSDATWYSSSAAWNSVLQDWRGWMEEGIMDVNLPMNYFRQTVAAHALDYTNWSNFAKDHKFNRHAVIGPGIYLNSVDNSIKQMRQPRQPTLSGNRADGVCGYDYHVTNTNGVSRSTFLNALVQPTAYDPVSPPIFAGAVPTPAMPWKTAPTKGHLKGFVYGGSGSAALDGARVVLSGASNRSQTNDATGFYGFVDLPPGAYTVSASFPGYGIVTSNITVVAGVVSTCDLVLADSQAPVILGQPQSISVPLAGKAIFTVNATGAGTLGYQWRFSGGPLADATDSALQILGVTTNHAGPYDVVITNDWGSVTSAPAQLQVILPPPPGRMNVAWSLAPGARSYLTINSLPNERGLAYSPGTGRLLVASRNGPHVYVLNAQTGADLHELSMTGVSGGAYPLLLVGVADDGAVYAANLTTAANTTALKVYRWASDNPGVAPTTVFSGDPNPAYSQRWGDTLDVRGAGASTQLLLGSRSGTNVLLLTTTNGLGFVASTINVTDMPAGSAGLGLAFGAGNTFWCKANGLPLRQVAFNLVTRTGSTVRVHGEPAVPNTVAPIGVSTGLNLLAGINISSPNQLQLYDLAVATPSLLATNAFPTDNDNTGTGTGAVDFGGEWLFALDANNGILAMKLALPPTLLAQPQAQLVKAWSTVSFSVQAGGFEPLAYQWRLNGASIAGATSSTYSRVVQTNDAGFYSVVVTNIAGWALSEEAELVVLSPTVPRLATSGLGLNGTFRLNGSGDTGRYRVMGSSDLLSWQELAVVASADGAFSWTDPQTNLPRRFYRAVWMP